MPGGGKRAGVDDLHAPSHAHNPHEAHTDSPESCLVRFVVEIRKGSSSFSSFEPRFDEGKGFAVAWPVIEPGLFCRLASLFLQRE